MKGIYILLVVVFSFCPTVIFSQESDSLSYPPPEKNIRLKKVQNSVAAGSIRLSDSYLSPLSYQGGNLGLLRESFILHNSRQNTSAYIRNQLALAGTSNPAGNHSILYIGYNIAYGRYCDLNLHRNFRLKVGGLADFDIGAKYHTANANNPISIDFSGLLNASSIAEYKHRGSDYNFDFRLHVDLALLGFMFVPEYGASYYEIFSLQDTKNIMHFSFLHNKFQIRTHFQFGLETKFSYLNFGILHFYQSYEANHLKFSKNQFMITFGLTRYISVFKGKLNRAPEGFLSPDF